MKNPELIADCSRCAALCCVGFPFEKSEDFAIDKGVGEPCPHLGDKGRCAIHEDRARAGFRGCIVYDCHGAGQVVTQDLFGGNSWQDMPILLGPMLDAFKILRQLHGLRALLASARDLPLSREELQTLVALEQAMAPPEGKWTQSTIAAVDTDHWQNAVHDFLQTLKHHFPEK